MLVGFIAKFQTPHAMLFTGASGCGKTTAARVMALALNCFDSKIWDGDKKIKLDGSMSDLYGFANPCCTCDACKSVLNLNSLAVIELDGARTGDVATIRKVLEDLPSAPMGGERYKVLILDEAHNLSGKAEDALLKFLEDTPEHVYIILCTNLPQKLKEVTLNRCKIIQFNRLQNSYIFEILKNVCEYEGYEYKPEILNYILEESDGVPRQALTYLQQISSEGTWTKDAASLIINAGIDIDYIEMMDFCRSLMKHRSFQTAVANYKKIKNIPIEIMRISICGFFVGCLRNSKTSGEAKGFSEIVEFMSVPYFNNPKPEHIFINSLFKITQILRG
jgi:DNA polymerase III subunit gamma/tau